MAPKMFKATINKEKDLYKVLDDDNKFLYKGTSLECDLYIKYGKPWYKVKAEYPAVLRGGTYEPYFYTIAYHLKEDGIVCDYRDQQCHVDTNIHFTNWQLATNKEIKTLFKE